LWIWLASLSSFSSIFSLIDPITVVPVVVSLIKGVDRVHQRKITRDAPLYAFAILLVFAVGGTGFASFLASRLHPSNRGGNHLFLIGIEMVYTCVSYTKQPAPRGLY
jgi:small neutral amino acid transporter SnatA (MarC family)